MRLAVDTNALFGNMAEERVREILKKAIKKHNEKILLRNGLVHCAYCKKMILKQDKYCQYCGKPMETKGVREMKGRAIRSKEKKKNNVVIIISGEEGDVEEIKEKLLLEVRKLRRKKELGFYIAPVKVASFEAIQEFADFSLQISQSLEEQENTEDHKQWLMNKYYSHKIIELLKEPMKIEGICTNEKEQLISCTRLVKILKHTISVVKSKPVNFWYDEEL